MDPFVRIAAATIARDARFAALAGGMLMVASSPYLPLCFTLGACVALLFSLVLLVRAGRLTDDRLMHSEPWHALEPGEHPTGERALRQACETYRHLLLRCAKSAAGNAIVLLAASLIASVGTHLWSSRTVEIASLN